MGNLFKSNSDKATEILMKIKLLFGALAVSTYSASHEDIAFWLLVAGGLVDVLVSLFSKTK